MNWNFEIIGYFNNKQAEKLKLYHNYCNKQDLNHA